MISTDLVRIRNATELPGDAVVGVVLETLAWLRDWPLPLRHSYARRLVAHAETETLVALSASGSIDGFCRLRHRHLAGECWFEDLYVRPASRGRGVGGALVAEAVTRARRGGFRLLGASIERANLPARRLAAASGFHEADQSISADTIFVAHPFDEWRGHGEDGKGRGPAAGT